MDNKNLDRDLRNVAAIIRRVENEGFGRNIEATRAAIRRRLDAANRELLDSGGSEADCDRYLNLHDRAVKIDCR